MIGWDLSLRAQSKRALAMNSIWLHKDREDGTCGSLYGERNLEYKPWRIRTKSKTGVSIDRAVGINLEGNFPSSSQ